MPTHALPTTVSTCDNTRSRRLSWRGRCLAAVEPVAEDCVSLPVDDIGECRVPNAPVSRDDTLTEEHSLTEGSAIHDSTAARYTGAYLAWPISSRLIFPVELT